MQMDRAVNEMLSDATGPDKVIVVIDARGASALQATRHVKLFKDVCVCLNQVRKLVLGSTIEMLFLPCL